MSNGRRKERREGEIEGRKKDSEYRMKDEMVEYTTAPQPKQGQHKSF